MDMVSYAYRDATAQTVSAMEKVTLHEIESPRNPISPSDNDELPYPFGELGVDLTESELRETANEIIVGAYRSSSSGKVSSSSGKTLKYVSSSSMMSSSSVASKVKKALALRTRKNNLESVSGKKASSVSELMRHQMRISEQTDSRIRRAFLRVAAGQLGRRLESMVLPLELLQQFKFSDFPNPQEYEVWQRRNLKLLEAGLVLHPCLPLDETDTRTKQLQ